MRFVLVPWFLLAACEGPITRGDSLALPDAMVETINCDASAFTFVAPRPELHYDPDLVVIADMDGYYWEFGNAGAEAVDDLDRGYEPVGAPSATQLANGLVELRWSFSLAASRRYTLYFNATECDRTVEFFTSAP